jgi:uncharacterized protein
MIGLPACNAGYFYRHLKEYSMDGNLILLALIVLISYTTQAMSGFGSTILALTLGIHLYPVKVLLPVLVPLDMLVNLYLVARHYRHLNRPLLFRSILPAMGIGVLAGIFAFQFIQGVMLKKIFGMLVVLLSLRELYRLIRKSLNQKALSRLGSTTYMALAGLIHGIYASGGPLLIYAVGRLDMPKAVFRSTLAAVWFIFSVILTASYFFAGTVSDESLAAIAMLLPVIVIGLVLGEWMHHRIAEYPFKVFVFVVLLVAGFSICFG